MRRKEIRLVCLAFIAGSLPPLGALAENWFFIGESESKSKFYVDLDSFPDTGDTKEFWNRVDASQDSTEEFREKKTLVRVDCKKRRLGVIYSVEYYPNGTNDAYGPNDFPTMNPVVPGSMGETVYEVACD